MSCAMCGSLQTRASWDPGDTFGEFAGIVWAVNYEKLDTNYVGSPHVVLALMPKPGAAGVCKQATAGFARLMQPRSLTKPKLTMTRLPNSRGNHNTCSKSENSSVVMKAMMLLQE